MSLVPTCSTCGGVLVACGPGGVGMWVECRACGYRGPRRPSDGAQLTPPAQRELRARLAVDEPSGQAVD